MTCRSSMMAEQTGKLMNFHEIALAARFVEALDVADCERAGRPGDSLPRRASSSRCEDRAPRAPTPSGSPSSSRGFTSWACRFKLLNPKSFRRSHAPALLLSVVLTDAKAGETRGAIVASSCTQGQAWLPLGKVPFRDNSSVSVLDGATLSKVVDRTVASAFVTVKPARRTLGSTTLKVENRLPFTISNLVVKAGSSSGSPSVPFSGVGVGPARSALLPIQAATASLVEHVELNGL